MIKTGGGGANITEGFIPLQAARGLDRNKGRTQEQFKETFFQGRKKGGLSLVGMCYKRYEPGDQKERSRIE